MIVLCSAGTNIVLFSNAATTLYSCGGVIFLCGGALALAFMRTNVITVVAIPSTEPLIRASLVPEAEAPPVADTDAWAGTLRNNCAVTLPVDDT